MIETMASTTPSEQTARATAIIEECRLIATMTDEPGRTTRLFLTKAVAEVHAHLRVRMEALGMQVRVDPIGNLRGVWTPSNVEVQEITGSTEIRAGRLVLGSHIDSVPDAGAFDGVLGVVLALEWVKIAQQIGFSTTIEVIAFSEEEGVRFGIPFLGSRSVAGVFDSEILSTLDENGIRMDQAIQAFGLDPSKIKQASLKEDLLGFIEIHIEQGPVLDHEGLRLAVVDGIVGQSRLSVRFEGQANHAGTTPMHLRHDALTAAAEWMLAVESEARESKGLVATTGKISVQPNAGNVIPGTVDISLDVRHMDDPQREHWVGEFTKSAMAIGKKRGVQIQIEPRSTQPAIKMDVQLKDWLLASVEQAGFPSKIVQSGAGHDAMIMATKFPTAMLFLRSPGGISHHPAESVLGDDVEASLGVAECFLRSLGHSNSSKSLLQ